MMLLALSMVALSAPDGELIFERSRIGTTTYEACSIVDINNDGEQDIVSGEYWYPGPDFTQSHKICDITPHKDYFDDFGDFPMDVNQDGYTDIVSGAWFGKKMVWKENPKGGTGEWTVHDIATVGNVEKPCFWDVDGDGQLEIVPNTPNDPIQVIRVTPGAQPQFKTAIISSPGSKSGHGLGFGDINGDGRGDFIVKGGWYEQPEEPWAGEWTYHPTPVLYGDSSVPILVYDINGDSMNDLIVGSGHDYGLSWWEQGKGDDGKRTWTQHEIENKRSQFHELWLADLTKDGIPELITGKRYYAHSGGDPGADEPVGLYYYELNGGQFIRHTIDYGPADKASGSGIYLWTKDIDGNGWVDVLAPGKEGMYLFKNQGPKH